jgi:hypothetical protein
MRPEIGLIPFPNPEQARGPPISGKSKMPPSENHSGSGLLLTLGSKKIHHLFQLLQQGFMVRVQVGCSVRALLSRQLNISPEFLEGRIKTIFLDGRPVDDMDSAIIKEGSTLALSAALPGLAGATLRRGGALASLRSQLSHPRDEAPVAEQEGFIVLKLFNLLMDELGPALLHRGVFIKREVLKEFLRNLPKDFWAGCPGPRVDGKEAEVAELVAGNWPENEAPVPLRVEAHDPVHNNQKGG